MAAIVVSGCGNLAAWIAGTNLYLEARSPPFLDYHVYDLTKIVSKHREISDYDRESGPVRVKKLLWEPPLYENSTKIALHVADNTLNLVLIFEINQPKPIIIEADPIGVAKLQWLEGPEPDSGSYRNCTQIAIFLSCQLHVKIYSLLTTTLQFTIPKPLSDQIIFHATKKNIWSLLAMPYYKKNLIGRSLLRNETSIKPVLFHFWNNGTTSTMLASLKLDLSSDNTSTFSWSKSGNWFLLFDASSTLSGYLMSVFNILGLSSQPVKDLAVHSAQPIVKFTSSPSCSTIGANLTWTPIWVKDGTHDQIYAIAISDELKLYYRGYNMSLMLAPAMSEFPLASGLLWSQGLDSKGIQKYSRIDYIPYKSTEKWKVEQVGDRVVLMSAGNLILALSMSLSEVEVIFTIVSTKKIVKTAIIDESKFLIAYEDHIVACSPSAIRIVGTTEARLENVTFEVSDGSVTVTSIESYRGGPSWKTYYDAFSGISSGTPNISSSPIKQDKKQLPSEKSYEVTDTFQQVKRRKLLASNNQKNLSAT